VQAADGPVDTHRNHNATLRHRHHDGVKGIVGIVSEGAGTIDYKRRFGLGPVSLA
jgi:hypothetical protein